MEDNGKVRHTSVLAWVSSSRYGGIIIHVFGGERKKPDLILIRTSKGAVKLLSEIHIQDIKK